MATEIYAGPVDYLVFAFPDGARVGAGLRQVLDRVDGSVVELLDVEVVTQDGDGRPVRKRLTDLQPSTEVDFSEFEGVGSGILDEHDLDAIVEALEPGHFAIAIVYEDRSLAAAAQAWSEAGGVELFSGGVDIADLARELEKGTDR